MKKTIAILLLSIFAFEYLGIFVVFKIQQYPIRQAIRESIQQGIPENKLAIIPIGSNNSNELDWEFDDEFEYKGKMYDVVRSSQIQADSIIYYCLLDGEESDLFDELDEAVRKTMENKHQNEPIKQVYKMFSNLFYPNQICLTYWYTSTPDYCFYRNKNYQSPGINTRYQPPEYSLI